ncbi:LysE family translocator [uncultured Microbulbifer sp.]|uniref:LysE family translocator n=1 Tax=uncultured Microbulbifer sp. TaxID=348147 RepID=UPI00262CDCEB|nr:LysE family translocator [uncultured Microbulbifer sp.]
MISVEFLLTSLVVVLIPGIGVLYTISTGLFIGKRASLFAAFGCTLGIIPSLLASVIGLAAIFHTSALAFQNVKYTGAAYLLYLACAMWRSASTLSLEKEKSQSSFAAVATKGFIINILNPKLSIFFLALLPQFVSPSASQPLVNMFLLGLVFMAITFGVFIIYGFMASTFSEFAARSEKFSLGIQKIFSGSFAVLGFKLAFSEWE